MRRYGSPVGLVGVLLCLVLPFLTASCSGTGPPGEEPLEQRQTWQVTWTGTDVLAGGRPDVAFAIGDNPSPPRRLGNAEVVELLGDRPAPLRPQPLAWAAVALIMTAIAVAASGETRRRAAVTAGLALVAGLALLAATLLAREQATEQVAEMLRRASVGSGASPTEPVRSWEHYARTRGLFGFGYGFWLSTGVLLLVGMTNVALAVPGRRPRP